MAIPYRISLTTTKKRANGIILNAHDFRRIVND